MRKLLLLALSSYFCIASSAQVNKGALFLGGDIFYANGKSDSPPNEVKFTNFGFSPLIGVGIKNNLVVGGNVIFRTGKSTSEPMGGESKTNGFGLGAFLRKYYRIKQSDFSVLIHGSLAGFSGTNKNTNPGSSFENDINTIGLAIYPGLSYKVSKTVQLEAGFSDFIRASYNWETQEIPGGQTSKYNRFDLLVNVFNVADELYFGVRIFLNN